MKRFTEERREEIIDGFSFDEYDTNRYINGWDIDGEYFVHFLNEGSVVVMILNRWTENVEIERVNKVKVGLTGDFEDDMIYGLYKLLDV